MATNRGDTLKAALKYRELGYSVIPAKPNKTPYVKWEKYQSEPADTEQLRTWFKKWSSANPAIATGKVSGIDAVDADSEKGKQALEEFLPESLSTPISKTPHGWHYIFSHTPGLSNGVRVITDCDVRTTGGYIIAPPAHNGEGGTYTWLPGLSPTEVSPAPMPEMLVDILRSGAGPASSREHINDSIHYREDTLRGYVAQDHKRLQKTTKRHIRFEKGGRDEALFHTAHHLIKGGMPEENVRKILKTLANACIPPFSEKETEAKIKSALDRAENQGINFTQEIRDWIKTTKGYFNTTLVYKELQKTTSQEKKRTRTILGRLVDEGLIERDPNSAQSYRIIDNDCSPEDWQNACTDTVDLWLPFGLDRMIEISPGSEILFAGSQDAGKSALMLNTARHNMKKWNVHYFSSELNPSSFKSRISKFNDITPDMWNVAFYQRGSNFADVIKTGSGNLNIIDYLEMHEQFYLVSKHLADIHNRLDGAIAVVALQKDPNAKYGRGGSFTQEKPVLSISLDRGVATISKFKGEWMGGNPNGKQYRFKIINGCRLKMDQDWHIPPPKN